MTYAALEAGKDMKPGGGDSSRRRLMELRGQHDLLEERRLLEAHSKPWSRKLLEVVWPRMLAEDKADRPRGMLGDGEGDFC